MFESSSLEVIGGRSSLMIQGETYPKSPNRVDGVLCLERAAPRQTRQVDALIREGVSLLKWAIPY